MQSTLETIIIVNKLLNIIVRKGKGKKTFGQMQQSSQRASKEATLEGSHFASSYFLSLLSCSLSLSLVIFVYLI